MFWSGANLGSPKDSYPAAQYQRLAQRRGRKRALVALTLLGIIYAVLTKGSTYQELGAHYLDQPDQAKLAARLIRRLERL